MTSQRDGLLPERRRVVRGFVVAVGLWLFFLVATAYTSGATLLDRVASTDVMRAASGGAVSGKLAGEVAYFLLAIVLLHGAFAVLNWALAIASAILSATARAKLGRMVVGWFCLLAGGVLAFNALWYPRTLVGAFYHDSMSRKFGGMPLGQALYLGLLALCVAVALAAAAKVLRGLEPRARLGSLATMLAVAVVSGLALLWPGDRTGVAAASNEGRPHVIVLGIDSLRLEQLRRFGGTGLTPNLDRFLERADIFADTTTPAARTYSSWMAILTGRAPTITGARFNLAQRSSVQSEPTLADVLRKQGYRTIYSTDEVRFANIDESYGFDEVVTPRIGASDFLIGTYNELPLSSLVVNSWLGKVLFPFSYANRGVATMFQPGTYIARIRDDVEFDEPTLLIAHLTAAHWPYYTADTPFGVSKPAHEHDRPSYRIGLQTADRMFGELVAVLERKGALENAVVVVLSDHGEALGLPTDSFFDETFQVEGLRAPVKMADTGHGQSVLSRSQYQVLFALRSTGSAGNAGVQARSFDSPVTVEDIAPTLLGLLEIEGDPLSTTGRSLMPLLEGRMPTLDTTARIRYTETDLRVLPAQNGGVDEVATARQNSAFFEVDAETARLHIRPSYAPLALAYKERAAFTRHQLLAALPAGPYAHQYLLFDFAARRGRLLLARPGNEEPQARRLWDSLHEHFAGELRVPVATTRADWERNAREWDNFIRDRQARGSAAVQTAAQPASDDVSAPGTT